MDIYDESNKHEPRNYMESPVKNELLSYLPERWRGGHSVLGQVLVGRSQRLQLGRRAQPIP